jgi:hypothetical protein
MIPFRPMKHAILAAACLVLAASLSSPAPAQPKAEPDPSANSPAASSFVADICRTLAQAAADNDLPEEFFTRLIWQESRFNPDAVSPAGAQGIAQFMPGTARMRGLINAFEPLQALRESASYLRELRTTFRGNLGLAAAAYNAGPGQVEAWLAGRSRLPLETQAYLRIITGHSAEEWTAKPPPRIESSATPTGERCIEIASLMKEVPRRRRDLTADPAWGPWGVQLAGNWSEGRVLAHYERLRRKHEAVLGDRLPLILTARRRDLPTYSVRVSEKTRAEAEALCGKLRAAGGACIVFRNPRD